MNCKSSYKKSERYRSNETRLGEQSKPEGGGGVGVGGALPLKHKPPGWKSWAFTEGYQYKFRYPGFPLFEDRDSGL